MSVSVVGSEKKAGFFPHWEKSAGAYTGDDVIDAYLKGKEAGRSEQSRILLRQLDENMALATSVSEELFKEAQRMGIKLRAIHLKAEDITKYRALFIAKKDDFVSDDFRSLYVFARKLKKRSESDRFYISFSFMPFSKQLHEDCLVADGFFMKYGKK